jgi:glycosyltransferase involved in cell wall biosynthesis
MEQMEKKGVIAFGLVPYAGGTTTFYRLFAQGLRARGWQVYSVAIGAEAQQGFDPLFGDENSVVLAPKETALTLQVKAFLNWLEQKQIDIVIPTTQDNILSAVPHLPPQVHYLSICHSTTRGSYALVSLHRDRLSAVVAINKRQFDDLKHRWRLPPHLLRLIPHGIDLSNFSTLARPQKTTEQLRLIFLGRLDDMAKGIMLLPAILKKAGKLGVNFLCDVLGTGPDEEKVKKAINNSGLQSCVGFHGQVPYHEVPGRLSSADIFLMPSRFEGFPLSLVEAMAAGCVPVATDLQGITDIIIEDGMSGFLCPMGDAGAFAEKISLLYSHRDQLERMSEETRRRVQKTFSLDRMAADYDALFTEILSRPPVSYSVRPLEEVAFPRELRPTWRTMIPLSMKNFARQWLYRLCGRIP